MSHKSFLSLALAASFNAFIVNIMKKWPVWRQWAPGDHSSIQIVLFGTSEKVEKWHLISWNHPHEKIFLSSPCGQGLSSSFCLSLELLTVFLTIHRFLHFSFSLQEPGDLVSRTHRCSCSPPPPSHSASLDGPSSRIHLLKWDGKQGTVLGS